MIGLTEEEIWSSDSNQNPKMDKQSEKVMKICLIIFASVFIINMILIYNFCNMLCKL